MGQTIITENAGNNWRTGTTSSDVKGTAVEINQGFSEPQDIAPVHLHAIIIQGS